DAARGRQPGDLGRLVRWADALAAAGGDGGVCGARGRGVGATVPLVLTACVCRACPRNSPAVAGVTHRAQELLGSRQKIWQNKPLYSPRTAPLTDRECPRTVPTPMPHPTSQRSIPTKTQESPPQWQSRSV